MRGEAVVMSRNRVKGFIPWIILTMVLCYGQYQTYQSIRLSHEFSRRGAWLESVTAAIDENMQGCWTKQDQESFADVNGLIMPGEARVVYFTLPKQPR